MPATFSVQAAHDELLRLKPEEANHADCPLCTSGAGTTQEKAEEVRRVPTDEKVFTEAQHVALAASAVEREVASIAAQKEELESQVASLQSEKASLETTNTDLQNQIDVLESEKAAEVARADAAEQSLESHKNEIAEAARVENAKAERMQAVKAADATLPDDYFTSDRVTRWAQMAQENFDVLVSDLEAAAAKKTPVEDTGEKPRETAAFTGGTSPSGSNKGASTLSHLLTATGLFPAAKN